MSDVTFGAAPSGQFASVRRKEIQVTRESMITESFFDSRRTYPLVVRPVIERIDTASWVRSNRPFIEDQLVKYGSILFRDFPIRDVPDFHSFVDAICDGAMPYMERSSPRSQVAQNIYTSTDYPADQRIFPHNEHSYSTTFPLKLFFWCQTPPHSGGETPLCDTRRLYERLDPSIKQDFAHKGWMYMRNYGGGCGLPWQTVFQTDDRAVVQEYCRAAHIQCEWVGADRLRTRQVRPAVARHPRTGDTVWFNHATFFHISTLEHSIAASLLEQHAECDLPNNTYYGDGSRIPESTLCKLRDAYQDVAIFQWQQGDVVLLDNMLTAHAREPFAGERRILFAMAEPHTRTDL